MGVLGELCYPLSCRVQLGLLADGLIEAKNNYSLLSSVHTCDRLKNH